MSTMNQRSINLYLIKVFYFDYKTKSLFQFNESCTCKHLSKHYQSLPYSRCDL